MTKKEFIPRIAPIVQKENEKRGNPLYSSVVIAQSICESNWGQSQIMMKANAIFGIKAGKNWKGKVYNAKTKECYDGINYTTITDCFRAYNNLEESIADYFDLICGLDRYKKALNTNSPLECITAIKKGGYATSPTYINTIMQIINSSNLTQFDKKGEIINNYFVIGNVYTLKYDLRVRTGAGTNYRQKTYLELTPDGKKHAYKKINAVLKEGTKVTCLYVIVKSAKEIWIKIPSGYIAGIYEGKEYIK